MKQTWTVYTANGDEVRSQRWTERGPDAMVKVLEIAPDAEAAAQRAAYLQGSYDRLRKAMGW
jgi:hypothetical protein